MITAPSISHQSHNSIDITVADHGDIRPSGTARYVVTYEDSYGQDHGLEGNDLEQVLTAIKFSIDHQ